MNMQSFDNSYNNLLFAQFYDFIIERLARASTEIFWAFTDSKNALQFNYQFLDYD